MAVVQGGVLTFVIVGGKDQPIYEADFTGPKEVRGASCIAGTAADRSVADLVGFACLQQQTQYLHQFVLHASLDAVDEAMWSSKELHLKVSSRLCTGTCTRSLSDLLVML